MIRMIMMAKWCLGNYGSLNLPDIFLQVRKNPGRNLTQETCPDRGSNPGPLRDRRAYCSLLHSGGPPNIITNLKSKRLRWAGYVARMEESRNIYKVLVGKPECKWTLGMPNTDGMIILKWILRNYIVILGISFTLLMIRTNSWLMKGR